MENNEKLKREIEKKMQAKLMLEQKLKCSTLLSDVLLNNLSEEEIKYAAPITLDFHMCIYIAHLPARQSSGAH